MLTENVSSGEWSLTIHFGSGPEACSKMRKMADEIRAGLAFAAAMPKTDALERDKLADLLRQAVRAYDTHDAGSDWGGVMPIEEWIEKSRAALASIDKGDGE